MHGTFTKVDLILGHKVKINFKGYTHTNSWTAVELTLNNRKVMKIYQNILKLSNLFLNNSWVKEEVTVKIRRCFKL